MEKLCLGFLLVLSISILGGCGFNLQTLSVDEFIKEVNPPHVSKLMDSNGEMILCVCFEDQISVRHSMEKVWKPSREEMKMHSMRLKAMVDEDDAVMEEKEEVGIENGSCPEGTMGIRETKRVNVERSKRVGPYATKHQSSLPPLTNSSRGLIQFNDSKLINQHASIITEYAVASHGGGEYGAFYGRINAHEPYVVENTRSTAQVWVCAGGDGIHPIQVMEAGWQANPSRYGDIKPRFFVYWTNDNYGKTGCFDLDCPGFVAFPGVGSQWIGKPYPKASRVMAKQIDYPLMISQIGPHMLNKGQEAGWYLTVNGDLVGYWPSRLFVSMKKSASVVHWGGLVAYPFYKLGQKHTSTEMGSGRPPSMGYQECAYINNIKVWTSDLKTFLASAIYSKFVSRPSCYDALIRNGLLAIDPFPPTTNGIHLFFGGMGFSYDCTCAERDA